MCASTWPLKPFIKSVCKTVFRHPHSSMRRFSIRIKRGNDALHFAERVSAVAHAVAFKLHPLASRTQNQQPRLPNTSRLPARWGSTRHGAARGRSLNPACGVVSKDLPANRSFHKNDNYNSNTTGWDESNVLSYLDNFY